MLTRIFKIIIVLLSFVIVANVFAASPYYCDCAVSGGTGGDGSWGNPFESFADIEAASFNTGDDLYFLVNTTCTLTEDKELHINWEGSSGNWITIGAYYGEGQFGLNGNNRPILDGDSNNVPDQGSYRGLLYKKIDGVDKTGYIEITDLKLIDSGDYGIYFDKIDDVKIENCHIYKSWRGAIYVDTDNITIDKNIINENKQDNAPPLSGVNGGIVIVRGSNGGTVSRNVIYNNWGSETLGMNRRTQNIIVEENVLYDNHATTIYCDAAKYMTIRYNLIYSSDDALTWAKNGVMPRGISINNETSRGYCFVGDTQIYGNVIAVARYGISLGCAYDPCELSNVLVYNNTIIDSTDANIKIWDTALGGSGNEIKNNISWTYTVGDGADHVTNCNPGGFTFDYNMWDEDPGSGNCDAANDPPNAVPGIFKTSGWRTLTAGAVDGSEFVLQTGSPCIDAASELTLTDGTGAGGTAVVTVDEAGYFCDGFGIAGATADYIYIEDTGKVQILSVDSSTQITLTANATWGNNKKISLCPEGVCYSGSAPDIGAEEYGGPQQNKAPYGTYTPGGDVTIYHDVADTIFATCTIVDDEGDAISYLWTLPNSDKDASTDEDPGTVTFTCGSYPCSHSCSLKVTDEHGEYNTYSFTVTHNETSIDISDITFWWRMEAADFSGTNGTYDYSAGDDVATLGSGAVINTDAVKYGTNGLDCPSAYDDADFIPSADDIIASAEGRVGFWMRIQVWVDATRIFLFQFDDGNNRAYVTLKGSSDSDIELRFTWIDGGNARTNAESTTWNAGENTWYFVELAWKTSTNYRELFVDGVSIVSSAETIGTFASPANLMYIGVNEDKAGDIHFDNLMISNDSTRDFNALSSLEQYPGYGEIGSIGTTDQDGTYGIDDSLVIPVFFVDGSGKPKTVTLNDGGNATIESYATCETGGDDLKVEFTTADSALSTHWVTTTGNAGYKIIAGMISADLSITSITIGGDDSIDADTSIPAGENLDDNANIVIDTTSPTVNLFYHCDSSKVQIAAETTYAVGDTCYLCVQSDGDTLYFNDGPTGNVQIGTDMAYPDKEEFEYHVGFGTTVLQFYRVIQAGDRDLDLQAEGVAGGTGLIHGATKIIDAGSNEIVYTLNVADPAGGNIIIAGLYPSTEPKQFDSVNTVVIALAAGFYFLPDDFVKATTNNSIGDADMSTSDGTSGHPITFNGKGFSENGKPICGDYTDFTRFIFN